MLRTGPATGFLTAGLLVSALSGCAVGGGPSAASPAATDRTGSDRAGSDRPATPSPTGRAHPGFGLGTRGQDEKAFPAYSATSVVRRLPVYTSVGGPVTRTLTDPQPSGAPLVLLVLSRAPGWLQVQLPVRPNGTTGWVLARDVRLSGLRYRLDVHLATHRLDVVDRGTVLRHFPIGVGTRDTPTPGGTFYLKELLQPPDPSGPYGPFAYGLSGYSTRLTSFAGGDGVIGIHGTDDPTAVGRDVSHGCIRLRNVDITALTRLLPLGTPVRILAD
ncbi:MAG: L,D-transpeptidase [Pseudorhodobacter sp.]|nr:L,D-transpeptidase [Frankiaceae bacterium]